MSVSNESSNDELMETDDAIADNTKKEGSCTPNQSQTPTKDETEDGAESTTTTPASITTKGPLGNFESPAANAESPVTPTNSKKRKRLTPDERLFREKERAEKRQKLEEEKQRKEEEKRKREAERQEKLKAKEQERLEKERQKEQERLKREEVKEQERIKRDEENAKRAEEKRKKEEERLKKEEERLKKEEERLKKEEEKRKLQEEKEKEKQKLEEKKAKQAQNFTKFFQKSPLPPAKKVRTLGVSPQAPQTVTPDGESDKENKDSNNDVSASIETKNGENTEGEKLESSEQVPASGNNEDIEILHEKKPEVAAFCPMPFQIKTYMAVAPLTRKKFVGATERALLDTCFSEKETEGTTVSDFLERCKRREGLKSGRTKVQYDDEETDPEVRIVMEVEEEDVADVTNGRCRLRMKLVQFHDNRRPAYWGTWRKKANSITGRRPFAKEKELDYEFDSDDEWEDEPEDAEEIEHSDGEEEKPEDPGEGEPVDEEDEEGWMVPHGYLSDSEREGEHVDLETIKNKEQEFFRSLKEKVKASLPVIQSENLSEFKMMFPLTHRKIRRSVRSRKAPSENFQNRGFLALELPSDDEGDADWEEDADNEEEGDLEVGQEEKSLQSDDNSSSVGSSSESEDSDDEFEEDEEESDMDVEMVEAPNKIVLTEDSPTST